MTKEISNVETGLVIYAKRFFSGTLLSRISGMGRDLMMAYAFGDHPSVAAFMVAFRLSNLFRRLLGEGPLQSAFIPYFEGLRVQDSAKATDFFRKLIGFITVLLVFLIVIVEVALFSILSFCNLSEGSVEILLLSSLLFPGLLFICLYGFNISLLNCYDSFFIPSIAPLICNVIWILAALFLMNLDTTVAMNHLAKWVVVGYLGQWLFTLPLTLRFVSSFWKDWFSIRFSSEIKSLVKSFSLGAIGVGAMQINAFADAVFARYADIRGPIYLWYSIRLEQLALAIFGILCISTVTPSLSRAIKSNQMDFAKNLFSLSYKRIIIILTPCTFAMLALGLSGVNLLYGYGNFSETAVYKTAYCLFAYALSLLPSVFIMLYSAIYYAKGNFHTPMILSVLSVIINLILNAVFVFIFQFGAISTAIATSIAAWINCFLLFQRVDQMGWKTEFSLSRIFGVVCASLFAFVVTVGADHFLFGIGLLSQNLPLDLSTKMICFSVEAVVFLFGFLCYAVLLRNNDILDLVRQMTNTHAKCSPSQN